MKKKRIALISPKSSFFFNDYSKNELLNNLVGFDVHQRYWSGLGPALPIIASVTDPKYEVVIVDENVEEINYDEDYTMVCITAMTHQAIKAYQILSEFRKRHIYTVIGGIHASCVSDEALHYADTVVMGEVENVWPELLRDFENNSIKKKYNSLDYPLVDLTQMPVPRYDLLVDKGYKIIWLNTSRGCPYDCEFCTATRFFGKKQRRKSISQVVSEIVLVKRSFKRILIGFGDNNIFLNKQYTIELLAELKKLNITWIGQCDITIGDDNEILQLLHEAGCQTLFIGFESLNPENLSSIYSGSTRKLKKDYLDLYEKNIEKIQSHGVGVWGSFIAGLDFDTKEIFYNIIDFVKKTNMLGAQITVLTPLPGTRLRERLLRENRIIPTSWDNYTFTEVNYIPKKMTHRELEEGIIEFFREIYSKESRLQVTRYFKEVMTKIL